MSRDIATIILRTVSACAESPYFTLSSFVTPVDEHRDLIAEVGPQSIERVLSVLDCVVEERGGHRLRPETEIREDLRDRDRCVMYGSPLRRTCPRCASSAV